MDSCDNIWVRTHRAFNQGPLSKGITLAEHIAGMVAVDVWVGLLWCGMLAHTFFPMVGGSCEQQLTDYLVARRASGNVDGGELT